MIPLSPKGFCIERVTTSAGNGLRDLNRFYTDADGDPLSFSIDVAAPHIGLILFKTDKDGFLYTIDDEGGTGGSMFM